MARHSNTRLLLNHPSPSAIGAGRLVASALAILERSAILSTVTSSVNATDGGGGEFARETTAIDTTFRDEWTAIGKSIRHGFGPLATTVELRGFRDRVALLHCNQFISIAARGGGEAMVHRFSNSVRRHWLAQLHLRHARSFIRANRRKSDAAKLKDYEWNIRSESSCLIKSEGFKDLPLESRRVLSGQIREYIESLNKTQDHLPHEENDREWWIEANHELIQEWWNLYVEKFNKFTLPSALIFRDFVEPESQSRALHFCWHVNLHHNGHPILSYILRALRARDRIKSLPLTIQFGSPRALLESGIRDKDYTTLEQIPDDLSVLDPEELWIKISEDPAVTLDRGETDEKMLIRTPIICRSRDFDKAFSACLCLK